MKREKKEFLESEKSLNDVEESGWYAILIKMFVKAYFKKWMKK